MCNKNTQQQQQQLLLLLLLLLLQLLLLLIIIIIQKIDNAIHNIAEDEVILAYFYKINL